MTCVEGWAKIEVRGLRCGGSDLQSNLPIQRKGKRLMMAGRVTGILPVATE